MKRSVGDGFDLVHEIGRMQATTHGGETNSDLDWPSVNKKIPNTVRTVHKNLGGVRTMTVRFMQRAEITVSHLMKFREA